MCAPRSGRRLLTLFLEGFSAGLQPNIGASLRPCPLTAHHKVFSAHLTYRATSRFYSLKPTRDQDVKEPGLTEPDSDGAKLPAGASVSAEADVQQRHPAHFAKFCALLQQCRSPSDVLDLSVKYVLPTRELSNCFSHMWKTTKKMTEEQRHYEKSLMFEHPAFGTLCERAMQLARHMSCLDVAYCLLALVKLGVSQRSRVVQTLLRAAQEKLNRFDEKALSLLASCLPEMDSSKNVDALKAGLQLLVESRTPQIKSVIALQTLMRCIGKDAPLSLKRKLENKALTMAQQFSLPNAQYMFTTLACMDFMSVALLDICSTTIIENITGIPFWRLVSVLQASRDLHYRNVALFSAIADYVTSTLDMWQMKQVMHFLSLFEELAFLPTDLMDILAKKVMAETPSVTLKELLTILRVYSSLNYMPKGCRQEFLDCLSSSFEGYHPKMSDMDLLRGTFALCLLGHLSPASLDRLMQDGVQEGLLSTDPHISERHKQLLHYIRLCQELDRPDAPHHLSVSRRPPRDLPSNPSVHSALQEALGEADCQQGVILENEYDIDFEVTLTDAQAQGVEMGRCQRVAVLCLPPYAFSLGTQHPRGRPAMKVRHLTALGYLVVMVPEASFEKMPQQERVQFLRSQIFPAGQPVLAE
ncbi:FAST kinase domain-containing protein 2, mitochondrial [Polypterus senegalus]|uniref:FAST kinase domain-containing protein 2, mitochondrial n=1 Tax=Polypterus senegalus TaxID=55291 RepID=UPI001966599E|nr:FAST kinase domain-containing protein 2, mitochondrial [Polypterus senegalus]XP_039613790.1 FAST kinase domain-containing protein 2, mitochondrial [Polypterus senegalus]XP_039613791.1 FAST kinase domain-containing protein 2, mitochondrial [Polypterus senegalus]